MAKKRPRPSFLTWASVGGMAHSKTTKAVYVSHKKRTQAVFWCTTGAKAFHIDSLGTIVKKFYDRGKLNILSSIAYKGGHFERDLLNKLQIPSTNLESFGCPKANLLFDRLVWLETCGHRFDEYSYQHCPKVEVEVLGKWLSDDKRKD